MESSSFKIEKLRDKDNWLQWRFVIRTLLEEDDDMLDVCEGRLIRPERDSADYAKVLKNFLKADKAARKLIVTTVERKPLDLLLCCTSAREMWKKLNTVYDMKSDENLTLVQKQFFDFKWDSSESVSHNVSKIEQLSNKMKSLGSEVPESMLLTRILSILPRIFNHFHSAWDSVEDSKKTLENLIARLMSEEVRIRDQDVSEESVALFTKTRPNNAYTKSSYTPRPNQSYNFVKKDFGCYTCGRNDHKRKDCTGCNICGSKGHLGRNCFRKFGNPRHKNNYSNGNFERMKQDKEAFIGSSGAVEDFWLIDSGASDHMTHRREWFCDFEDFKVPLSIKMGNGDIISAYGKGSIDIETRVNNAWIPGIMYDVLYAPNLQQSLFAVKVVARKGIDFSITNNGKRCIFTRNNNVIATGSDSGNLYKVNLRVVMPKNCNSINAEQNEKPIESLQLWHERLCHQNYRHVKSFISNLGITIKNDIDICDGCAYGKQHRRSFHEKIERATRVREIIHTDVCGPMDQESLGRKRYFLIFKDDFSGFRQIYFIREKSEVVGKLKLFCNQIETQFTENIKEIHSDGGREFKNKYVGEFLSSKGIKHTINVPYTPEQNGIAERENRIIVEAARSMIYSRSDLPLFLWAEAMNTAVNVINRTGPTKQPNKTPYELWYGKLPTVKDLKIFGTECFVHIPAEKRRKLDKKALKGYLVGYIEDGKGFRVYVPSMRDVLLSRDVLFKSEKLILNSVNIPLKDDKIEEDKTIIDNNHDSVESVESNNDNDQLLDNNNIRELRDRRKIQRTDFYGCPITYMAESLPANYKEAITSRDKEYWQDAMQDEINSLHENKTWILVENNNQKVINGRWVFTKKLNPDNTERYKARLVIKGYSQKEGIDYKETFSPVVRFDTIRFLLSIAARYNLRLGQFDIKTAFLYGDLKENIYMKQPEGFDDGTNRVCKLLKSLYGLKQAPRCWTEHFTTFLKNFGFCQSKADACFYIYHESDKRMFLAIYVDDGIIAASDECLIDKLFEELNKNFKTTNSKNVTNFLGIEICKFQDGSIFISQEKYIKNLLDKFNLLEANSVSTPIEVNWNANDFDSSECNAPFREAVGSLIFLQVVSRPDISFAVNIVARVLDKPSKGHWLLVKRIIRYLKGTLDVGLLYCKDSEFATYSDADFAGDKETRKSTSGILCKHAGAAITWQSKKQQCVTLSTTEAEYVSATLAAKEIIWLKKLFCECNVDTGICTLFVDNLSAVKLIKNPEFHQRSKHIDVKYHFIRDLYAVGEIDIQYVKSDDQIADIFTKALAKPRFLYLKEKLGLIRKCDIVDCKDVEF